MNKILDSKLECHTPPDLIDFLKALRDEIVLQFETLEESERFQREEWTHHSGGGGEISLIRGSVFEKAAVNWSHVWGEEFPLDASRGPFAATGVSLITHMNNPHAPTVHMNIRYVATKDRWWLGGGYDLTPMGFIYPEDSQHFHAVAQRALLPFGDSVYSQFSQNAREYFYIPHRKKERGIGGIFFDYYNTGNQEKDLELWRTVGQSFLPAVMPIYARRIAKPFTESEKNIQLKARAHYVEFNLLYDRGTKFGFSSGGNPKAILCSMPPVVKW